MYNWSIPQRQSAFGIFMFAGKAFREWLAFLIIMTGSMSRKSKPLIAWILLYGASVIIIFGKAILQYLYFTFSVSENNLIVRKGIFSKKTLVIPFERIQTVQLRQNLLHKLIGHCKVAIDTAGTEKTEVSIHSLAYKKAVSLREILTQEKAIAANTEEDVQPVISLAPKDLFKMALSANHLETFFLIVGFVLARFDDVRNLFGADAYDYVKEQGEGVAFTAQAVGMIIVVTLLLSIIISVLRIILKFSDLTIRLSGKGFQLKHGLLNSEQQFIGAKKIQYILWKANWIRRKLGMYMFYVKTAGEDELKKKQRIHVPVTRETHLQMLSAYYQQELPSQTSGANSIQKQYVMRRVLLIGFPVTIAAAGIAFIWWEWYSLWIVLWLVYFIIRTIIYRNNFTIWVNEHALELSKGVWGREKLVLNWNKLQMVTIQQSIYQRKNGLASLSLHTASGEVKIPYLEAAEARMLADYALMKAEISQKSWM